MKANEELKELKKDVENLNKKLAALSEEELNYVVGDSSIWGRGIRRSDQRRELSR